MSDSKQRRTLGTRSSSACTAHLVRLRCELGSTQQEANGICHGYIHVKDAIRHSKDAQDGNGRGRLEGVIEDWHTKMCAKKVCTCTVLIW